MYCIKFCFVSIEIWHYRNFNICLLQAHLGVLCAYILLLPSLIIIFLKHHRNTASDNDIPEYVQNASCNADVEVLVTADSLKTHRENKCLIESSKACFKRDKKQFNQKLFKLSALTFPKDNSSITNKICMQITNQTKLIWENYQDQNV